MCLSPSMTNLLANIWKVIAIMRKLSANISTCWNSRFQYFGFSARLIIVDLSYLVLFRRSSPFINDLIWAENITLFDQCYSESWLLFIRCGNYLLLFVRYLNYNHDCNLCSSKLCIHLVSRQNSVNDMVNGSQNQVRCVLYTLPQCWAGQFLYSQERKKSYWKIVFYCRSKIYQVKSSLTLGESSVTLINVSKNVKKYVNAWKM